MDNPETLATLVTQDTGRRQTKRKIRATRTPLKTGAGVNPNTFYKNLKLCDTLLNEYFM